MNPHWLDRYETFLPGKPPSAGSDQDWRSEMIRVKKSAMALHCLPRGPLLTCTSRPLRLSGVARSVR